jgi:hypothetical protein
MKSRLALSALFSIASLALSGCGTSGYQRECDWCDDASKTQLRKDVEECNAEAVRMFPDRSRTYKTGRIVTSHGSTSCSTNKRGDTTCTRGSDYTYEEEVSEDVTDYAARKKQFMECTDLRAKNYTSKAVPSKEPASQGYATKEVDYKWDIKTAPEDIQFGWEKIDGKDDFYISTNPKSIQVLGDRRVIWALKDQEVKGKVKIRSMVMQVELDCALNKMRPLVGYAFPEPMGKGELIARMRIPSESSEGAWKNFSPNNRFDCFSIR